MLSQENPNRSLSDVSTANDLGMSIVTAKLASLAAVDVLRGMMGEKSKVY